PGPNHCAPEPTPKPHRLRARRLIGPIHDAALKLGWQEKMPHHVVHRQGTDDPARPTAPGLQNRPSSKTRYPPGWNRVVQWGAPPKPLTPVPGRMVERSGRILRWSHATNSTPVRPRWLTGRCLPRWQIHVAVCPGYIVNYHLGPQCGDALMRQLSGALLAERCPWHQRAAITWRGLPLTVLGFLASGQ